MKKAIYTLFAIALAACTAESIPETPTTPESTVPTTEKVSINVRLAEPATKTIINDSGSGAASFSWENGDEIGVVVDNKYYCFTLEGKTGEDTGTFTAELPSGSTIEDGAQIAYPYIADDYNESTNTFSLTYPTEYTSTKAGDFRHRWAGTLVKDGSNNFQANLAHQTAILRITYANVPADATAIKITADKNLAGSSKTITTNFSWHASTMDFHFPVPAETYTSFTIELYNGADAIDGTQRTLANTSMLLETGKIYRNTTKAIADSMADILGADTYQITPTEAYNSDNSNYYDENTRAYQEQYGPASARPAINATLSSTDYDVVLLGFPIWYGKVPRVVLTFLDTYDFSGKVVIPFCTSGSSGISTAQTELQSTYSTVKWKTGARLNGYTTEQLKTWLSGFGFNNAPFKLTIGGNVFNAELANNATARAFDALLPTTLSMTELHGNEKYKYLDTTLPTNASCPGTIHAGDILLYGNNCVVVFYKTFATSYSYTKIGRITDPSGLAAAVGGGNIEIQFGY